MKTIAKKSSETKTNFNLFENLAIPLAQQTQAKGGGDGDGIIFEDVVVQ